MPLQALNHTTPEDVEYLCKLFFTVLKTSIYFVDNLHDIFFAFSYGRIENPLHPDKRELFKQLFEGTESFECPIIRSTKYMENYFAINLCMEGLFLGKFVVGPSLFTPMSRTSLETLIADQKIPLRYRQELSDYYESLSIFDYRRLIGTTQLFYQLLYNQKIDFSEIAEANSSSPTHIKTLISSYEHTISENRKNTFFHHTFSSEKKLFTCIRDGNLTKLAKELETPLDGEYGILSKNNPLRHHKNLVICLITLVTRMAIEGGLDTELAYTLSDSYIQGVEELHDIKDLYDYRNKILYDITKKVQKRKELTYSKSILLCQDYIHNHLYENITLPQLSKIVHLSANYLSELFKKEVGMSVNSYMQQVRIEEAKRLLISSSYSLLEISTLLTFHDQSHFTRIFKKGTGFTPKKYRDLYTKER